MTPHKQPDEKVAATDAVFEELAAEAEGQPGTGTDPAAADPSAPPPSEVEQSPVGDYVRELQEEFQEHEDDATP